MEFADEIFEDGVDELVHNKVIDAPRAKKKAGRTKNGRSEKPARQRGLVAGASRFGGFYRGNTHILSTITLGGPQDAQLIEGMEVQTTKHFMHHYNFPPFSVGETGRMGSPGRREIGHGALVEKAPDAGFASKERFSLHYPSCFRSYGLQRLHFSRLNLRLHSRFDGRRRADQKSGGRNFYGLDDEKRQRIQDFDRHPRV